VECGDSLPLSLREETANTQTQQRRPRESGEKSRTPKRRNEYQQTCAASLPHYYTLREFKVIALVV
jgi:hypothetical protein